MRNTFLITGGAGSIGSSFLNFLLEKYKSIEIVVVDFSESSIAILKEKTKVYSNITFYVGDISDTYFLKRIFNHHEIDVVIHCAAYKHVVLMQNQLYSLVKNNLIGLKNTLEVVKNTSVSKFVFVSTDKAVCPTSYMGMTKRIGEKMIALENRKNQKTHFCSVRFGNVKYTKGSVFDMFEEQWNNEHCIYITDRNTKRFFISSDQANELIHNAITNKEGDLFINAKMSEFKIYDLGIEFLKNKRVDNPEIYIKFMGMRTGEKLVEKISYKNEKLIQIKPNLTVVDFDEKVLKEYGFDDLFKVIKSGSEEEIVVKLNQMSD